MALGWPSGLARAGDYRLAAAAPHMQDEEPKSGGMITMSLADQDVTTFDPPVPPDNMSIWTMLLFYEQLIRVAPDGLSLEPGLAESWEVSDDGKTYTFKVRDAQFHDGTPFTAEDAAFCIDRAAKKEGTPWQFIISVVDSTERLIRTPALSTSRASGRRLRRTWRCSLPRSSQGSLRRAGRRALREANWHRSLQVRLAHA